MTEISKKLKSPCCNKPFVWVSGDADVRVGGIVFLACSKCRQAGGEVYKFLEDKKESELYIK